jgi:hypothetical protein
MTSISPIWPLAKPVKFLIQQQPQLTADQGKISVKKLKYNRPFFDYRRLISKDVLLLESVRFVFENRHIIWAAESEIKLRQVTHET